ncbi:MAG: potassium/proton antiporter [Longimonas sp.]|uniref:potassium/proton antiporter n=1 Tax=Longimonas sp. TaxID=2039626 RepID=UPI00334AB501
MSLYVLLASLLIIAAIVSTGVAQRAGVPALVLFVGIGVAAGSAGVPFTNYELGVNIGMLALAVILLSGGLDMEAALFRASLVPAGLLATAGVLLKTGVMGLIAWWLTPLDLLGGLLLGAILAPTDAAAVFSVLKGCGLPKRLQGVLETESGTNDPISIYLTILLASALTTGTASVGTMAGGVVLQLAVGAVLGYGMGRGLVLLINQVRIDSPGLYPVLALAGGLLTYAATDLVGGNGFLAIYVVGVVLGNAPLVHRHNIQNFMDGVAWGAQISMFLLLGLLVVPADLIPHIPAALLLTVGLVLVARPVSVVLTLAPLRLVGERFRFSLREQALLSWAGLKGAVPIILAMVPLVNELPGSTFIFNVTFVCVVVGTALQGLTIVPVGRWLGLATTAPPPPPLRIELAGAAPPGSAVLDVLLEAEAPAVGERLAEIAIPPHMIVAALVRDGTLIAPRGHIRFQPGDHVYVLTENADGERPPDAFVAPPETPEVST